MGVYVAKPMLLAKLGGHDLPLYSTELVVAGHISHTSHTQLSDPGEDIIANLLKDNMQQVVKGKEN